MLESYPDKPKIVVIFLFYNFYGILNDNGYPAKNIEFGTSTYISGALQNTSGVARIRQTLMYEIVVCPDTFTYILTDVEFILYILDNK